jgi:hypothetical protein
VRLTPSRISPPLGADEKEEKNGNGQPEGKPLPEKGKTVNGKYHFSEQEKQRFRDDPEYFLAYRKKLEATINSMFDMYIADSDTSIKAKEAMEAEMSRRIGPSHEELKEKLIPSWPPGCKLALDSLHLRTVLMRSRPTNHTWDWILGSSCQRK